MANYTVFKPTIEKEESFRELPPNYHLKKARSTRAIDIPQGYEQVDSYTPTQTAGESTGYRKEEENILNLFKRLNERLFGSQETSVNRPAVDEQVTYTAPAAKENEAQQDNPGMLHPVLQNSWWNNMNAADEKKGPAAQEMTRRLEDWCQMEYDQTREQDEAFYTPQQLRDRISVFREINAEFSAVDQKKVRNNSAVEDAGEPWDLVTPLPVNSNAIETYRSMEEEADDEESYRQMYHSSTFELVA